MKYYFEYFCGIFKIILIGSLAIKLYIFPFNIEVGLTVIREMFQTSV